VLPKEQRLRSSAGFTQTVRRGVKAGRPTVVVHALNIHAPAPTRVGFVVDKHVGSAVTRNRVKRRLRHLVAARLATSPVGLMVVVRATPLAASLPHQVPGDLSASWHGAMERALARSSADEWRGADGRLRPDVCVSVWTPHAEGAR